MDKLKSLFSKKDKQKKDGDPKSKKDDDPKSKKDDDPKSKKDIKSKMNSPKPKIENTKIDQATMDALKIASDKSKMELLRTASPESPESAKKKTADAALDKIVPDAFKVERKELPWKKKKENFVVPSAESLESFERIVARRREKNRIKKEKSIYRRVLESDVHEYKVLKFMLHFPFGLIFGYAFFKISLDRLDFDPELSIQIGLAFIIIFSGCFALTVTFRCLAILLMPHLFGEVGRVYVYTICVGIIIAGPLANLVMNIGEVLRSIGCQFEVFVNLTKSRIGIRIIPLLDALMDIISNQQDLSTVSQDLISSLVPVHLEIASDETRNKQMAKEIDEDEADLEMKSRAQEIEVRYRMTGQESRLKRMQKQYMKKLELMCEKVMSAAVRACTLFFRLTYDKCVAATSVISALLCWPCKLTFFCNLFKMAQDSMTNGLKCDSMQYLNDKFSETIQVVDDLTDNLKNNFQANMQYEGEDEEEENNEKSESEGVGFVTKSVLWQFKVKKVGFDVVFQIMRRLLVLIFVFLVYRAQHYMQLYQTVIDFDNRYVTKYFNHIDERRRAATKRTLLPLKKLEQREVSYQCSFSMTDDEKKDIFKNLVRATVIVLIILLLLLFDHLLAEIMDFVSSIARMDFIQHGRHHVAMNLTGTGIIAKMLRTIFGGFNRTHVIDNVVSNAPCMPKPQRTAWTELWAVYLCVAGVYATAIFEAPVMRTRRLICDFFYPKREKKRVLFLYNDMMRKRIGFLHEARHKVRKKCKRNTFNMPLSFLTSLRYQFPGKFEWLRKLKLGRQNCLICNEAETGLFIHCPTFQCKATYCRQCWIDVNARCYACRDDDDWTIVSSGGASKKGLQNAMSPWQGPTGRRGPTGMPLEMQKKKKKKTFGLF